MKNVIITEKIATEDLELLRYISIILQNKAKESGRDITWLQFAKKTRYGYKFLKNKEKQWEVLNGIATKTAKKFTKYTTGQIVDIISELVNTTVMDDIAAHGYRPRKDTTHKEKIYLGKSLIEVVCLSSYVPGYSRFMTTCRISRQTWRMIDISDGKKYLLKISKKAQSLIYVISSL